jgi:hypothetical protein
MSRIQHSLDSRFTEGCEGVSLSPLPRFTPQKNDLVLISVRCSVNSMAIVRLEGLGTLKKKSNDPIGTQTCNLSVYSILPQPTTLPLTPYAYIYEFTGTTNRHSACILISIWGMILIPQEGISRSLLQQPGQYRRWTEVFAFAWETDASRTLQSVVIQPLA